MCQHPNIIKLIDIFENPDYIFIILEYLPGGDLFDYLSARNFVLTEERVRQLMHQLAAAVFYLHNFCIAHRDLKLENIMMSDTTDRAQVKIVDFGLSKLLGPSETSTDPFGTITYVAPEVLLQKPYGKEVDVWSMGIIMHVLLSGTLPFDADDNAEIAQKIIYNQVTFADDSFKVVSSEAKRLIKGLLTKESNKRMTI